MRFRPEVTLSRLGVAELRLTSCPDRRVEAAEDLRLAMPELQAMGMVPALSRTELSHLRGCPMDG